MLSLEVQGLETLQRRISNVPKQARFAMSQAMNDVAFKARDDLVTEIGRVFDRPTPWLKKTIWVGKKARPESLETWIYPRDVGGKSVDPASVLIAEVMGGPRRLKRAEVALQRVGILPKGYFVAPGEDAPLDGYGNIPGPFWVRLLSYLQAFGEQGYSANKTVKGLAAFHKSSKRRLGLQYFVKQPLRKGLPAGIWERMAAGHSKFVGPSRGLRHLVRFVRQPKYRKRYAMRDVFNTTIQREIAPAFGRRFAAALATAR